METPSASQKQSEMSLLGLHQPKEVRSMILKIRDDHGLSGVKRSMAVAVSQPQGLADVKQVEVLVTQQHETFKEIKDVLQDMRVCGRGGCRLVYVPLLRPFLYIYIGCLLVQTALVSMDDKMSVNGNLPTYPTDDM